MEKPNNLNEAVDVFNINIKTLESLHQTLEDINDVNKNISLGITSDGRRVSKGDCLQFKHSLIKNLLNWTNVLMNDSKKFQEFLATHRRIVVPYEPLRVNENMIHKLKNRLPVYAWIYSPEIDQAMDNLILEITTTLQMTGIFKMKPNDPRNIAGRR